MRTATYFEGILEKYSIEILSKNAKAIENDFLKPALLDQSQETRKIARTCVLKYGECFPDRGLALLSQMTNFQGKQQLVKEIEHEFATNLRSSQQMPCTTKLSNLGDKDRFMSPLSMKEKNPSTPGGYP